jgi:hypothetical protein
MVSLVGLAPHPAKYGDEVWIVLGCPQLLWLRRVNAHQHVIIGECYLHGHSYGEALLGPLSPGFRPMRASVGPGSYAEILRTSGRV